MITHRFNDAHDLGSGGTWFDDYGRPIGHWKWGQSTKTLEVTRGPRGKRIDLSAVDLTKVDLRERLPQIAYEALERIAQEIPPRGSK